MTAPNPNDRELLSLIPSLMRQVSPKDYIWSMDPRSVTIKQMRGARLAGAMSALRSLGIVLTTFVVLHVMGYRRVSPEQEHTLVMAERIDPEHELDDDVTLAERWGKLAQAYRLVRAAAFAPSGKQYPYIAVLSGHPAPAESPGNGAAVLLLANTLDFFPTDDQARLIGRLLALAALMDQPDVISAIEQIARLPNGVRTHLFANRAASFARIASLEQSVEVGDAQAAEIAAELQAQSAALLEKHGKLRHVIDRMKALASKDERVTRECTRRLDRYIACLPDDISSQP